MNDPDEFNTITLSVIVPVYRRTDWIGRCLAALASQDGPEFFEVIVVDDGSPNEQEICEAVAHAPVRPGVSVRFFRKQNAGPAAARNFAVNRSSGTILCFLDDDSIPQHNWLKEIVKPLVDDPELSVVSGQILSHDRECRLPLMLEQSIYRGAHWATCNIAYRRETFEALGGFDEQFREASWEDNDLGLRARWAGYRQFHNLGAVVFHPHERSLEEYRRKCHINGRGAATFSKKYAFRKPLWAVATPVIVSRFLVLAMAPSSLKKELSPAYLKFLWSYNSLKGFMDVMLGTSCE